MGKLLFPDRTIDYSITWDPDETEGLPKGKGSELLTNIPHLFDKRFYILLEPYLCCLKSRPV